MCPIWLIQSLSTVHKCGWCGEMLRSLLLVFLLGVCEGYPLMEGEEEEGAFLTEEIQLQKCSTALLNFIKFACSTKNPEVVRFLLQTQNVPGIRMVGKSGGGQGRKRRQGRRVHYRENGRMESVVTKCCRQSCTLSTLSQYCPPLPS